VRKEAHLGQLLALLTAPAQMAFLLKIMDRPYILSKEFLNWQYYHDNAVKTLYLHLYFSANLDEENEYRNFNEQRFNMVIARQDTGLTYKQVRRAFKVLIDENYITFSKNIVKLNIDKLPNL
jgi:hypothetical protein